jgi:hypothetical protein
VFSLVLEQIGHPVVHHEVAAQLKLLRRQIDGLLLQVTVFLQQS